MTIGTIEGVLKRQIGTQIYFIGTVDSDKIKGISFVPVIEHSRKTYLVENIDQGYQRPGSLTRMRHFMRFLRKNPNSVVPPILLSTRDGWEFVPSQENPNYGQLRVNEPAAIVDGQHRAGGYIALFDEHEEIRPVDFIALFGLSVEEEKQEFITVNNTQKGVPRALTAYLEDTEEARLAWALNEEEDSPFYGRIARTGMTRDKLFALHSVAKQIKRTFDHGKLAQLDEDEKFEILTKYWTIIADELEDEWADIEKLDDHSCRGRKDFEFKLLELTGFIAWSLIAPEILGRSYVDGVGMNWDNVRSLVRACAHVDWRKNGQYQGMTGEYGAAQIKRDLERNLPADYAIDESGE